MRHGKLLTSFSSSGQDNLERRLLQILCFFILVKIHLLFTLLVLCRCSLTHHFTEWMPQQNRVAVQQGPVATPLGCLQNSMEKLRTPWLELCNDMNSYGSSRHKCKYPNKSWSVHTGKKFTIMKQLQENQISAKGKNVVLWQRLLLLPNFYYDLVKHGICKNIF